jgi:hypothetical protein
MIIGLVVLLCVMVAVASFSLAWFVRGSGIEPYESLYIPPAPRPPSRLNIHYLDARTFNIYVDGNVPVDYGQFLPEPKVVHRQLEDSSEMIDL